MSTVGTAIYSVYNRNSYLQCLHDNKHILKRRIGLFAKNLKDAIHGRIRPRTATSSNTPPIQRTQPNQLASPQGPNTVLRHASYSSAVKNTLPWPYHPQTQPPPIPLATPQLQQRIPPAPHLNFLWFKIEKSFLNSVKDIYVCGVYIPPCNSKYFDLEIFDQLERDIVHFSTIGSVILMGDFNSRTGKYSDTVSQEGNSIITNDQSESAFQPAQRNSFDNLLNSHGKKLLEICKNLDLRIVNGRVNGDTLGRPTFHGKNGTSVIDYIICDQCTFLNVANFVVKQPSCLPDHSAIVAWLNLNTSLPASETQTSTFTNRLISLPRQFCWENDSYLKFRNALRTEPIQILIREFMERNTEDVNVSLDDAVNILTATSKICLKIKTKRSRKRIRITSSKKWFDRECQLKRHELRKLSNQKHRDPLNSELREKFHKILNDYKKLLDSKRKEFQKEKTLQLDELAFNPDKVSFWSCLKSMNDTIDENVPAPISEETWLNHFQSLHSNDLRTSINRQGVYDELLSLEKEKEQLTI